MNTPTRAEALPAVSEMTPATPARTATTKDQWSGCQMKPVSGRARVTASGVTHPPARASRARTATTSTAVANDAASSPIARRVISSRPRTTPVAAAAIAANSGPTTIAPTTSTEESVMTAIDASATATIMNA